MFKNVVYINFEEQTDSKYNLFMFLYSQNIRLTLREINLFYFLYINKNMICSYRLINGSVYNFSIYPCTIKVYIGYLRNKLKGTIYENSIITFRGEGYMFKMEDNT